MTHRQRFFLIILVTFIWVGLTIGLAVARGF